MEVVLQAMRGLAGVAVLGVVAELFAPDERARQDVRLICGLLLMLVVLQPVVSALEAL